MVNPIDLTLSSSEPDTAVTVQGLLDRILYHAPDSGYSVARLTVKTQADPVTIVGPLLQPQEGQVLNITGTWQTHPKYGSQLQILSYYEIRPTSVEGLEKYLCSGLIPGIGKRTAKRIVKHFGEDTLAVLDRQIDRLQEVPGLSRKRAEAIQQAWQSQAVLKDVMVFLQSHGVSTGFAIKIFQEYGPEAVEKVSENPYRLAAEIQGIGFMSADAIALRMGLAPDSEMRYRSGLIQVLREAADDGHCLLPEKELVERALKRLALRGHHPQSPQIKALIQAMVQDKSLMCEAILPLVALMPGQPDPYGPLPGYYAPQFFRAEKGLADRLRLLLTIPLTHDPAFVETWLDEFVDAKTPLSDQQRHTVQLAASHRIVVLTGLPGTGKTFTTKTVVALWKALGREVALASPTGRAAQRLSELAGEPAKTIHRLLEIDAKTRKFKRNEDNPIAATAIVVDEASMLDIFLANGLMQAVGLGSQILFVGDTDQLPSVGPGNVLQDLIASGAVPVVRLTQIFRQAATSAIITNAHRINQGQVPRLEPVSQQPQTDCLGLAAPEPEQGVQGIQDLLRYFIPKLGFNPLTDVQILAPMLRGTVGTQNLNQVLQQLLNPPHGGKKQIQQTESMILREGDRVIQRVNNYQREVFNGDLGILDHVEADEGVVVRFGDRYVEYGNSDLGELLLAYAMTIHKSQGSEYPVVILPLYPQHHIMLNRNLVYTGLTRARKLAIFVGPEVALQTAVRQVNARRRYTLLTQRLKSINVKAN
jgi:exodeoxyribonuclease V alpha subunit